MVEDARSRVDFAMAEGLGFGTLMLHRGAGPGVEKRAPADADEAAALGLNLGHYGGRFEMLDQAPPQLARLHDRWGALKPLRRRQQQHWASM